MKVLVYANQDDFVLEIQALPRLRFLLCLFPHELLMNMIILFQAIKKLNVDLKTIDWHVDANTITKQTLDQRLLQYRSML